MFSLQFVSQTGIGLGKLVGQMALIVIPLIIFIELLKDFNILDKLTGWLHWTVKPIGMSSAAVLPLLAGLFFGLVYGAGLIIDTAREGTLNKRDLYLISLFLVINHSLLEDTLLFVAIGANGWVVLAFRFAASIIITWLVGKFLMPAESEGAHRPENQAL